MQAQRQRSRPGLEVGELDVVGGDPPLGDGHGRNLAGARGSDRTLAAVAETPVTRSRIDGWRAGNVPATRAGTGGIHCSTSASSASGARRRARATPTGATAATPRASRSRRRATRPIVLDLGTGLRFWGETLDPRRALHGLGPRHPHPLGPRAGPAVLHPVLQPGAQFDVYGPPQPEARRAGRGVRRVHAPAVLPGHHQGPARRHPLPRRLGRRPRARRRQGHAPARCPTSGLTNGYRVEMGGAVVAYLSDHQMPVDGSHDVSDAVLEPLRRRRPADPRRAVHRRRVPGEVDWGHCTSDFAVHVAQEAGARRLALFHHDPTHHDDAVDSILARRPRPREGLRARRGARRPRGPGRLLRLTPLGSAR